MELTDDVAAKAIYLLGIAPESSPATRAAIQAGYSMLEYHAAFGLDAWVVRVDRQEFEGPAAEKNLANVAWLSPRVMAHQMAVQHLANEVALLPMRFGTLFSSESALLEFLFDNSHALDAFLAGDGRHVEWGIKCLADWSLAADAFQRSRGVDERSANSAGVNYLLKKKLIRERDAAMQGWLDERLQPIRVELQERVLRLCDRGVLQEGKGSARECMANWAVLVPRERQEELRGWIEELRVTFADNDEGISFEMTGPWPPYSFVPPLTTAASSRQAA